MEIINFIIMINKNIVISKNKQAYFNYFIEKEIEAGIILYGWEVKSIRSGKLDLSKNYISITNNEVFLLGLNIQPYKNISTITNCEPLRDKKLLLKKKEIKYLVGQINQKQFTMVALSMFWKNSLCKINCALVKSKKLFDKRKIIKNREWNIEKQQISKLTRI